MTSTDDDDFEMASDAIPAGSVRLSDAYSRILDVVLENPDILPPFDEEWLCALEKSRAYEKEANDPDVFDDELADFVHQQKRVNIFLRHCLEQRELIPRVRDPETGQTLDLPKGDWLPSETWCEYVPRDIIHDYIIPNDYEAPGPPGSFIRGKLRPVFFEPTCFEAWFEKHFGANNRSPPSEPARNRAKREACKNALLTLFPQGVPPTLPPKLRDMQVKEWILKNINPKLDVDRQTIVRALYELKA